MTTPTDDHTPEEKTERRREQVRRAVKNAAKRRIAPYASSEKTLADARSRMPAGLSLEDFLSQLIDRIAAGKLVPLTKPQKPR